MSDIRHTFLRRLEQYRHHRINSPYMPYKADSCIQFLVLGILASMFAESYIRNDTKHVAAVSVIHRHGIVQVGGKKDFRARTLHMLALLLIESLLQEFRTLFQYHLVKFRQICRIISYRILYKHDALYTYVKYIIISILKVLEQLDDRNNQICISMPCEHVVYR